MDHNHPPSKPPLFKVYLDPYPSDIAKPLPPMSTMSCVNQKSTMAGVSQMSTMTYVNPGSASAMSSVNPSNSQYTTPTWNWPNSCTAGGPDFTSKGYWDPVTMPTMSSANQMYYPSIHSSQTPAVTTTAASYYDHVPSVTTSSDAAGYQPSHHGQTYTSWYPFGRRNEYDSFELSVPICSTIGIPIGYPNSYLSKPVPVSNAVVDNTRPNPIQDNSVVGHFMKIAGEHVSDWTRYSSPSGVSETTNNSSAAASQSSSQRDNSSNSVHKTILVDPEYCDRPIVREEFIQINPPNRALFGCQQTTSPISRQATPPPHHQATPLPRRQISPFPCHQFNSSHGRQNILPSRLQVIPSSENKIARKPSGDLHHQKPEKYISEKDEKRLRVLAERDIDDRRTAGCEIRNERHRDTTLNKEQKLPTTKRNRSVDKSRRSPSPRRPKVAKPTQSTEKATKTCRRSPKPPPTNRGTESNRNVPDDPIYDPRNPTEESNPAVPPKTETRQELEALLFKIFRKCVQDATIPPANLTRNVVPVSDGVISSTDLEPKKQQKQQEKGPQEIEMKAVDVQKTEQRKNSSESGGMPHMLEVITRLPNTASNGDGAGPNLPSGLPPDLIELTSQIKTILQYVSKYPQQIQKAIEMFSQNKNGLDELKELTSPAKTSLEKLNQASAGARSSEQKTTAGEDKKRDKKPASTSDPSNKSASRKKTHETENRDKRSYDKNKTGKSVPPRKDSRPQKSGSWSGRPSPTSATTKKETSEIKSKSSVRTRTPIRRKSTSPPIRFGRRAHPSRPNRRVVNECHRGVKRGASQSTNGSLESHPESKSCVNHPHSPRDFQAERSRTRPRSRGSRERRGRSDSRGLETREERNGSRRPRKSNLPNLMDVEIPDAWIFDALVEGGIVDIL